MDPKTDYAVWRFWFDIGQYIVAFFIALYIWLSTRDKARSTDLKDAETRITKLETGAITHKDLAAVYERVNDVSEKVSKMDGKMEGKLDGVIGTVDMIQQWLINNGGKQ